MKKKIFATISVALCLGILFAGCSSAVSDYAPQKEKMALTNPNADETTKKVYEYICSTYLENIITAQQESTWIDGPDYEINYIQEKTGKLPAMRGLDYMGDDFEGVNERAVEWWNKGGIVTICWHCGPEFSGNYDNCKKDKIADWDAVLTEGTPENKDFIAKMDKVGNALLDLQKKGVPVLWRPFHEPDGKWFWWGKGGAENFKKLWILMYDHFTNDLGLNNLIWVLGFSQQGINMAEWYPGNRYCDIVGADSYYTSFMGAENRLFKQVAKTVDGSKLICFHECGNIPKLSKLKKVKWAYFMTWHSEWLTDKNSDEKLSEIYNSDYAITLDELPSFK